MIVFALIVSFFNINSCVIFLNMIYLFQYIGGCMGNVCIKSFREDDWKNVDKKKLLEDILVKKYGMNPELLKSSKFIEDVLTTYVKVRDPHTCFAESEIISDNYTYGDTPMHITTDDSGNLVIRYNSDNKGSSVAWPVRYLYKHEIKYCSSELGFKKITKDTILFEGMERTVACPDGEFLKQHKKTSLKIEQCRDNYIVRITGLGIKDDKKIDGEIDDFDLIPISEEDEARVESSVALIRECSNLSEEEIAKKLHENGLYYVDELVRDSEYFQKMFFRGMSDINGYHYDTISMKSTELDTMIYDSNAPWVLPTRDDDLLKGLYASAFGGNYSFRDVVLPRDKERVDILLSMSSRCAPLIDQSIIREELCNLKQKVSVVTVGYVPKEYSVIDGDLVAKVGTDEIGADEKSGETPKKI